MRTNGVITGRKKRDLEWTLKTFGRQRIVCRFITWSPSRSKPDFINTSTPVWWTPEARIDRLGNVKLRDRSHSLLILYVRQQNAVTFSLWRRRRDILFFLKNIHAPARAPSDRVWGKRRGDDKYGKYVQRKYPSASPS